MNELPEVRQCQDQDDPHYGAVAVAAGIPGYAWAIMHPTIGGHWDPNDETINTWTVLT